jgi:hypothetical protein
MDEPKAPTKRPSTVTGVAQAVASRWPLSSWTSRWSVVQRVSPRGLLGVVPVEHQVIGPVGPEHHQPGVGRVEVEVVVAAVDRLAEVRRQLGGGHPHRLVAVGDFAAVGDEGAQAVDVVPLGRVEPVERLRAAAAGAVGLQRELLVEQARGLGWLQPVHALDQRLGRGALDVGQVGEPPVLVLGPLGHVVGEAAHLVALQLALEGEEGDHAGQGADGHGHGADAQQEPTRKRNHAAAKGIQDLSAIPCPTCS